MKHSRYLFLAAMAAFGLIGRAAANTYSVTLTATITQSNDPELLVGTAYDNTISYYSDTPDGTFAFNQDPQLNQLYGSILAMVSAPNDYHDGLTGNSYEMFSIENSFWGNAAFNFITVTDGAVSGFRWDLQNGQANTTYINNTVSFQASNLLHHYDDNMPDAWKVKGTYILGPVLANVPDYGATVTLVFISLIFQAFAARFKSRPIKS